MPTIREMLETHLNTEQARAALDPSDEVLTLACAGSGKSRTLAYRIARLVAEGEDPASIVAFTFTEKAAETIKRRVGSALGAVGLAPTVLGAMYIGTIHSYCYNILGDMDARYQQFDVLDDNRLILYLISRYPRLGLAALGKHRAAKYFKTIKQVAHAWKTMNDEMLSVEKVCQTDAMLGDVLKRVSDGLSSDEFIDFSLMVRLVAEALDKGDPAALRALGGFRHLMVDEYQDVNPAQEAVIRAMHHHGGSLFVVGDDDQSIYGWRGADVSNILHFGQRYPACSAHTLSTNYRSTPAIVGAADRFIAGQLGAMRIGKEPVGTQGEGTEDFRRLWFATRDAEADWVVSMIRALYGTKYTERDGAVRGLTWGDFAILMRSTKTREVDKQTPRHGPFTQRLDAEGIPYSLEAGGSVFDRPQVAALRDTFELLRTTTPSREVALRHFQISVLPAFPKADFDQVARVLSEWGRLIHGPITATRRRVYPQQLVHDLLRAFDLASSYFHEGVMQDLGLFSRMMLDVETVFMSVDSTQRFQSILNFLQNVAESGYDTSTDDVISRPDTVFVSTVHKAKGLEFPVVFVVDVEQGRFPGYIRKYDGWLPQQAIGTALSRGAYQSSNEEEARLFYTAVTRAERYLYITGSERLPGGKKSFRPSSFAQGLGQHHISEVASGLPEGLSACAPAPRTDDTIVPTSYSDIRYYLRCPRDYQLRLRFGFSPPVPEMFGFGRTTHTAICRLHQQYPDKAPEAADAQALARQTFHLKHVPQSRDPDGKPGPYERARAAMEDIICNYVHSYSADFARSRQIEARFEIPIQHGVVSGAIDLLLREDNLGNITEATVVDFKTMEGGRIPEENGRLEWVDLSLQVQLYAKAAKDILGENATTGAVHLLKDNQRVSVPVTEEAVNAAISSVEWAVQRIIEGDFPMRPAAMKCNDCDFAALCAATPTDFGTDAVPPPIHVPGDRRVPARAFSEYEGG